MTQAMKSFRNMFPYLLSTVRTALVIAVLALPLPFGSMASIIAQDSFDYSPGVDNLQSNKGGIGWAGPWLPSANSSDHVDVVNTSAKPLTFTPAGGGVVSGSAAGAAYGPANAPVAARQLAAPLTNTFYISYLVRYDNTNDPAQNNFNGYNTFSLYLSDSEQRTGALNFGMRSTGGENTFMAREGTGDPREGASVKKPFLAGATHLMVAKVTNSGGQFNRIDCWLDPAFADSSTPTVMLLDGDLKAITHVFFREAKGEPDDRFLFTHLVIGTTWEDVVPPAHSP